MKLYTHDELKSEIEKDRQKWIETIGNQEMNLSAMLAKYAALQQHADEIHKHLKEAVTQIEYLHSKFKETGSGNTVISRSQTALHNYEQFKSK